MKSKPKLMLALGLAVMALVLVQVGIWIKPASMAVAAYSDPVGFVKIGINKNDYNQIASPLIVEDMALNDTDDSVACLGEMLSESLIGTTVVQTAPKIWKYKVGTGGFDGAFLFDSGGGSPGYDGKWIDIVTYTLSTMSFDVSTGMFLERTNDAGTDPCTSTVLGDVEVSDTVAVTIQDGYNMLAYPYPVNLGINASESIQTEDGANGTTITTTADQIYKYKPGGGFDPAFLFDSGGGSPGYDNKWIDMVLYVVSTVSFDPEEAFYYYRQPGQGTFTWTCTRPFSNP
jgi:hypothetical protein